MKKNKSILALASMVFVLGLTSCNKTSTTSPSTSSSESSQSSTTTSSVSSTSTSVYENHSVSLTQVEGVTLAVDKEQAICGDIVTVTLSGYNATLNVVTLISDVELEFTEVETQTGVKAYTFVMPDSAVSISATVELRKYEAKAHYLISEYSSNVLTYTYTVSGKEVEADQILPNSNVNLKVSGLYSYLTDGQVMYLYAGNSIVKGTVASETVDEVAVKYATFDFVMPASDLDLYICKPAGIVDNDNGVAYTVVEGDGVKVYGVNSADKYNNYSVTFFFVCQAGYDFEIGVTDADGKTYSAYKYTLSSVDGGYYSTIYGVTGKALTVTVTSEYKGIRNITYVGNDAIKSVSGSEDYEWPTSYTVGKDFYVYSLTVADGQYISSITIVGADGETIKEDKDAPTSLTFIMPDQDVTITFNLANNGTITWAEDQSKDAFDDLVIGSQYSYSSSKENPITSSKPGEYVYVHVKVKDGYEVTKLHYVTEDGTDNEETFSSNWNDSTLYYASFRMPSGNVVLSIDFAKKYTITIGDSKTAGCKISYAPTSVAAGKEDYFTVSTSDKFHYLAMAVATYDGEDHIWSEENGSLRSSGSYYYFTMPEADVTITPYFGEKETATISITAEEGISKFSISSSETWQYISSTGDLKVSATEKLTFSASITDSTKFLRFVLTDTNNQTHNVDPISASFGSTTSYSYDGDGVSVTFDSGAKIKSINATLVDREKATVNITNDIKNLGISYKVNGTAVDNLDNVLVYDYIDFVLDSTKCESGYKYTVNVTDADGNALTYNQYYNSGYAVSSKTVNVATVKSVVYSSTITYSPETPAYQYITWYLNDSYSSDSLDGAEISIGDKVRISSITLYTSNYDVYDYSFTITNGDETVGTYTSDEFYALENRIEFTVKGNVTIAFTVSLSEE